MLERQEVQLEEPLEDFHRGLTNILTHYTLDQDVPRCELTRSPA